MIGRKPDWFNYAHRIYPHFLREMCGPNTHTDAETPTPADTQPDTPYREDSLPAKRARRPEHAAALRAASTVAP
jgi:hypothetical protein